MRCNNCGWENPDGSTLCEKCNAPLQGGYGGNRQGGYGVNQQGGYGGSQGGLHSTIRESEPFDRPGTVKTIIEDAPTASPTVPVDEPAAQPAPQPEPQPRPRPRTEQPYGGTMNPYAAGAGFMPVSHCKLSPIIFPGEDRRDAPGDACFKGGYNELTRANLDAENNTITSKVQALLTNKDGKWYIQDQSAQQTTFVRATEPMQLRSGDIVLMGNRTFVFTED